MVKAISVGELHIAVNVKAATMSASKPAQLVYLRMIAAPTMRRSFS